MSATTTPGRSDAPGDESGDYSLLLRIEALQQRVDGLELALQQATEGLVAGQALQQQGMEGMQAFLAARIDRLDSEQAGATNETLVGLALTALRPPDPPRAEQGQAATGPEYRKIAEQHLVLAALEWQARNAAEHGDVRGFLAVARAAADWSCMHHPGVFASSALEAASRSVGRRALAGLPAWAGNGERRRVLHVLTLASPIGGHTRLAERWMRFDGEREHAVVLTDQGQLAVPDSLTRAASGGVHRLASADEVGRVEELARLALGYDVLILHIHPYDVVAATAFADPAKRPPTLLVDHGDHLFWLGVAAADAVVSVRPSGVSLVTERRGVDEARVHLIPVPVDPVERGRDRIEAKRALGLDDAAVVLLTVASSHKFAPVAADSFHELAGRVLDLHPEAVLVAIGPDRDDAGWASLEAAHPGRVQALGPLPEPRDWLEAADVYLDSFPFGSPTSLFEATLFETPAVVFRPPGVGVLAVEDADVELLVATDADAWVGLVGDLVRNPERRSIEGERLAAELARAHGAARIAPLVDEATRSVRHGAATVPSPRHPLVTPFDVALVRYQAASGLGRPVEHLLAAYGLLPRSVG